MADLDTADRAYYERLVRLTPWWKRVFNPRWPYILHLRSMRPGRTLDVGCGIGGLLAYLPKGSVGVDHNPHSVAHCRARGLEAYVTGELAGRFADSSFDTLLMSHLLEHLAPEGGQALLRSYAPLLAPGGKLVAIVPQERGYQSDATHVTFYTAATLADLCKAAGFEVRARRSFPLPRAFGKRFTHNETVILARKT